MTPRWTTRAIRSTRPPLRHRPTSSKAGGGMRKQFEWPRSAKCRITAIRICLRTREVPASPSATTHHVRLRLGHAPGVERLLQRLLVQHLPLGGDLPDGLAGLEAFLGDVTGGVVADLRGEARAHRQALLEQRLAALSVGLQSRGA